jgi:O-antigen biosynthesis protein WbqP
MSYFMIFRFISLIMSIAALPLLAVPMVFLYFLVRMTSPGPAIYWSRRVGKGNKIFLMPKFRTMRIDTPQLATHLMAVRAHEFLTPLGPLMRKLSLDELPQIYSILRGDMNIVGPRPALFNQDDLIELRTKNGVHLIPPGLTGWAQINGRDEISIEEKVALDKFYVENRSIGLDLRILFLTFMHVLQSKNVTH